MWSDDSLRCSAVDKTSPRLFEIFNAIQDDLARVDVEFGRHIESQVDLIPTIGKYIQSGGGKRIRPALLLMAARLCGYKGDRAVLYAAVVEFIHTATLVHDDIIDDSSLRRGRLAVHSQWGTDVSVLVGDYLYIKSVALALTYGDMDIIRVLCDVTLQMIEGELYQLTKNGDPNVTEEEHFEIIRRKTAFLFSGCARIGAMLAGQPADRVEALGQYGFKLGVVFQLVDDLLDLTGTVQTLGKPVASDLREGKITLPIIALMNRADPSVRALITGVVRDRALSPERWQQISALLAEHRAIDYAYDRAVQLAKEAKAHLQAFPPGDDRDTLMALPDFVLQRDR
jgi:octaprenyl-diphosphate synthase